MSEKMLGASKHQTIPIEIKKTHSRGGLTIAYNGITAFLGLFPFTCNWFKKGRAWGLRLNIGMIFSLKAKVKFEKRYP